MLGIIGSMDSEVQELKNEMPDAKITSVAGMDFYEGHIHDKDVVVVKCGTGKVNAAICTQILADRYKVDSVINTGVAGSLKNEINIGDIVVSTDALHHDVDVRVFGYPLGEVPQMGCLAFPADEKLSALAVECCKEVNPDISVYNGRIVSGDQFVSDKKVKEHIITNFGGFCVEMEGASIAHAAYLNHVPFVIIRAISDKADDSAEMDYPTFEKAAAAHSAALVEHMLPLI